MVALGALAEALLDYVLLGPRRGGASDAGRPLLSFFALFQTGVAIVGLGCRMRCRGARSSGSAWRARSRVQPGGGRRDGRLGLLWPGLWTAVLARGLEASCTNRCSAPATSCSTRPLALDRKRATKALVDVGFDKVGSVAGGLLTAGLVAATPGAAAPLALGAAALVAAAALALLPRLHRGYVVSLEESLRSGAVRLEPGRGHGRDDALTRWRARAWGWTATR